MFGTQLSASGISVKHSDGDADVDIISSALTVANTCPVTLLGEDTDLLIILLWHLNLSLNHPCAFVFQFQKNGCWYQEVQAVTQWWADTFKSCSTYLLWWWYHIKVAFWYMTYSITKILEKSRIPKSIEDL